MQYQSRAIVVPLRDYSKVKQQFNHYQICKGIHFGNDIAHVITYLVLLPCSKKALSTCAVVAQKKNHYRSCGQFSKKDK